MSAPQTKETSRDAASQPEDTQKERSLSRVALLLTCVFLSMFLVALDRTIVSTAVPQITDEFNSLPDVGWYGSAYLLTCCALQLLCGKLYTLFGVKVVYLASMLLFEIGSIVSGAAPNSVTFIVGRAIAGMGAAGVFAGTIVCIVYAVPLEKRPTITSLFGVLVGLASIVGPLIGGAFTSHVSWRWCFYINAPFGGVAMAVIFFCLEIPDGETIKISWIQKLLQFDILGTTSLVSGMVCLFLSLQWGGQTYAWSNGRIIALLTLTGVLVFAFIAIQTLLSKTATIPPRIFKQRSIIAGSWSALCLGSTQYIYVYFLPVWFQSVKSVSAVESGIRLLPLMLSLVFASLTFGFATQKIGYYTPFAIAGSCIMSVGAGLLTTLQVDTSASKWIGYQIIYGFGMGLYFQAPNLAAQTVLPKKDVPVGTSLMFFAQLLGAAIFVAVGESVLDNQLLKNLSRVMPDFNSSLITSGGATSLLSSVPPNVRDVALAAYNEALRKVFQIGLILSCLTVLGSVALEWRSVLEKAQADNVAGVGAVDEEKAFTARNVGIRASASHRPILASTSYETMTASDSDRAILASPSYYTMTASDSDRAIVASPSYDTMTASDTDM